MSTSFIRVMNLIGGGGGGRGTGGGGKGGQRIERE